MKNRGCIDPHATFREAAAVLAAAFLLLAGSSARAASFTIDPLKVELSSSRNSAVMRLQNNSSSVLTIQIQPKRWRQERLGDRLDVSRELVATPQIFRIKPKASQLVRIALLGKPEAEMEAAYRLVFDEIPQPPTEDFVGVQVVTRVSIPLFVAPDAPAKSLLKLAIKTTEAGKVTVTLQNTGTAHAHIRRLTLESKDDPARGTAVVDTPLYLLPGAAREVSFAKSEGPIGPQEKLSIKAVTSTGVVELDGSPSP